MWICQKTCQNTVWQLSKNSTYLVWIKLAGQNLSNFFVGILVETIFQQRHFEINWPLCTCVFMISLIYFHTISKVIYTKYSKDWHCWYIEPWNREKSLTLIWQRFSCLLDEWIAKNIKKSSRWLFEIIHIIRFEMRMDSRINLKIILGY